MQSELNKKLLDAIDTWVVGQLDTIMSSKDGGDVIRVIGSEDAANECEKICLQRQIDLLNNICKFYLLNDKSNNVYKLIKTELITPIKDQLSQLK